MDLPTRRYIEELVKEVKAIKLRLDKLEKDKDVI